DYVLKHLERNGPIAKAGAWEASPMICVRGLRRGASVLGEHAEDLSWVGISVDPLIPAGFIRSMKPDDHSRYKPLFRQAFAKETVDACAGYFRQEARKAVDDVRVEVTCDPGRSV